MNDQKEILIAKYISNNISEKEKEMLMQLLGENAKELNELQQAEKLWDLSANLKVQNSGDAEKAWNEFRLLAETEPRKKPFADFSVTLRVAAAVALLIVTSLTIRFFVSGPSIKPVPVIAAKPSVSMIVVRSGDSIKKVVLSDSSIVFLNKNSRFIYPVKFDRRERITFLTGEAFFNVTPSPVGFVVFCGKTRTKVLGTSCNIKGYETDKEVEVQDVIGKIEFRNNESTVHEKIVLTKNDKGSFNKKESSLTKEKDQVKVEGKKLKWWQKSKLIKKIRNFFSKKKTK